MNVKRKYIKIEIYNWLVACQVCALEDVASFNLVLSMFYGRLKVVIDGRSANTMTFTNSCIIIKFWTSNGSP
jgi:hypothetical protein